MKCKRTRAKRGIPSVPMVVAIALVTGGAVAVPDAAAAPVVVRSATDHAQYNAFTLDFGEFGNIDGLGPERTGLISSTDLEIEVDPDIQTARFIRYDQRVQPIILPGGFDTGEIRVEVVPGSSSGTFDKRSGVFVTAESYNIYFEGDLSAFGLQSPVVLESTSTGLVTLETLSIGAVSIEWSGETEIGSGELILPVDYTCSVNNHFVPGPVEVLALDLDPRIIDLALPQVLEQRLVALVKFAGAAAANDNTSAAIRALRSFIRAVLDGADAGEIDETDAFDLIDRAEFAIKLLQKLSLEWPDALAD